MQTFGESPIPVPDEAKDRIFNSESRAGDAFFLASDDLPSHQVTKGTNVALFVAFSDGAEQGADLVVLRENPLEDIGNTRTIEFVIQGGHVLTPSDLLR